MQNKYTYLTLEGLILSGVKDAGSNKAPTLFPGFRDNKPRFSVFFNDKLNTPNLNIEPDYNTMGIFIGMARDFFEKGEEGEKRVVVQGSKFVENVYIPGELVLKGVFYYGIKKGVYYLKVGNEFKTATFPFREPYRGKFFVDETISDNQTEVSKHYALMFVNHYEQKMIELQAQEKK